ncbi:Aminomethyltransferase folate-binding domain-containing protein [Mycena alexandri]|uniref:Aminomethyltransferase folate-binding domain-containing protein n=1 Tax=Mycena alexandri TaxID=1745969 RepID=A0AAD6XGP4_9AGAR|nr:Aminomethyltransferase folate-binding domain-containing protein [Mycena alexandri]
MPPPLRPLIPKIPTVARVPHRSVLSLAGSQASEFLNGIISTQVNAPPRPFYSAFLHAQGRVLYDIFVYTRMNPAGQLGYLIDYDSRPSEATPLLDLIKRYVLRSRVKVRDASDEYDVWGVWGSPGEEADTERRWKWAESSGVAEPAWNAADEWPWGSQHEVLRDRRAPGMGNRLLVRKGDLPAAASSHLVATSDAYTLHRILHGVPEGLTDMPAMQAFPMDSNLDFMGGLDFRKGCYVGQELTVRTYHTGIVRKRILPVVLHPPDSPPQVIAPSPDMPFFTAGLDIRGVPSQSLEQDNPRPRPRGTGRLLSSSQGLGLALLRLEQVEAAEQGKLAFATDVEASGAKTAWGVTHWQPEWWPHKEE